MGGSRLVVLRKFLLLDEMVYLFAFAHDGEWERLVWGYFDREVLVLSTRRFGGMNLPNTTRGYAFPPTPPHLLLDGGDSDADALDNDTGNVLSPPIPKDDDDNDNSNKYDNNY